MVVAAGFAIGVRLVALSRELLGVPSDKKPTHEKLYGGAPPVTVAWSCEDWPTAIGVGGVALTETFNSDPAETITVLSAFMTTEHFAKILLSHPFQEAGGTSGTRVTGVPAGKAALQLIPGQKIPGGIEPTGPRAFGSELTTVSVHDEHPEETLTVTESEAVWLVLSVTVTVYVVVVLGVAMGLAVVGLSKEALGVHEKVYGIAPPVAVARSCEVWPGAIGVGGALTETFNGKTVLTTICPEQEAPPAS